MVTASIGRPWAVVPRVRTVQNRRWRASTSASRSRTSALVGLEGKNWVFGGLLGVFEAMLAPGLRRDRPAAGGVLMRGLMLAAGEKSAIRKFIIAERLLIIDDSFRVIGESTPVAVRPDFARPIRSHSDPRECAAAAIPSM